MSQQTQVASALLLFVLYASGIIHLGFYSSTFLYLCSHIWMLGMRRPFVVLPVSVSVMLVIYGVFELFLGVTLPRGLLY